jgi:hypothetical protein
MSYIDKIKFIFDEIRVLTGLEPEIICDDLNTYRFITDKNSSRRIDLRNINSNKDLVLYSRLISLDLTKPLISY